MTKQQADFITASVGVGLVFLFIQTSIMLMEFLFR
jgi:hypothetical protein